MNDTKQFSSIININFNNNNNKILRIPVLKLIFITVHMSVFKKYTKIDL